MRGLLTRENRLNQLFVVICLFLAYAYVLSHKINLVTADLGRHIQNGAYFFSDKRVLNINFYSYTETNFPTINHHWATGVLFFAIYQVSGFVGLQLFFALISLITFLLVFLLSRTKSGFTLASLLSLLILPLLAERLEIRPEALSNLFFVLILFLLWRHREGSLDSKYLYTIPAIVLVWVNTHIYFFLGPIIVGGFFLESLINKKDRSLYFKILLISTLITLANPLGLTGSLAPLNEFKNYGYRLAENMSIGFMEKLTVNPNFLFYKIVTGIYLLSLLVSLTRDRKQFSLANFLLGLSLCIMGYVMIRNLTLFGLVLLPLICANLAPDFDDLKISFDKLFFIFIPLCLLAGLSGIFPYLPRTGEFGYGLETGNDASIQFIKQHDLRGPIFNNYDIGGYLIYYLFPRDRVFVDNRPEAYSSSFLQDVYVRSQESKSDWITLDQKYQFNLIIFSIRDYTPWGQRFMIDRVSDPDWAPVFVDGRVLVLLRRNDKNSAVIKQFEIPKNKFSVTQ